MLKYPYFTEKACLRKSLVCSKAQSLCMVEPILNSSSVCAQSFPSKNTTTTLNEYVREFGRSVLVRWYFIWMVKTFSRIMDLQYFYL